MLLCHPQSTIHAMPDGAAERAGTVAQLTGYKPLPDGTRPLSSHPALLPPPPQPMSEEGPQEEEEDAPPQLELEEEEATVVVVEEEDDDESSREYALPRLVAELQPMLRCWAVQAWPPPPSSGISFLWIEQASAKVVFSGHRVGGEETAGVRRVELNVRFRTAAASEGAGKEKEGGEEGRWFQGVLPFVTTDAQDERGQRAAVRLPLTVEVCACGWE